MSWNVPRASWLLLGVLAACGGSASRDKHSPEEAPIGGAATDTPDEGRGGTGTTITAGTTTGGVTGPSTAGTGGGGGSSGSGGNAGRAGSQDLGGMDAGDAGAGTTLPLPDGCEPRTQMETADACSLAAFCTDYSRVTNCHRLASGRWQCQCETQNKDRSYELENAQGLQACALSARLCPKTEQELELGDEVCEPTTDASDRESCNTNLICRKSIELGFKTDARAWLTHSGSATCERSQLGDFFDCHCNVDQPTPGYEMLADGDIPDCRPLVDFCMSGATPVYQGAPQCTPTSAVSNSDGCEHDETCAVPMPLTPKISLADITLASAACQPLSGGGSECYCNAGKGEFSFQVSDAPSNAVCASSWANCADGAVIQATGTANCQPTSLDTFGSDSCRADLNCLQNATVDSRKIVAEGRLTLVCSRSQKGKPWWCSCVSDQKTARFELGAADVEAFQACSQAPAGCLQQLSVHLGPYGDFIDPPDPMPPPR